MKQLLIFTLLTLIALLPGTSSTAGTVTVVTDSGQQQINGFSVNGVDYISLSQMAALTDGTLDWTILGHQISYTDQQNHLDFFVGSPYFKLNNKTCNLTYATVLRKGELFVPAMTFLPLFDQVTTQRVSYDKKASKVRMTSSRYNVTDIAFSMKANGLLIEVSISKELAYDVFVTTGNWVNISIRDGLLDVARIESRKDSRYMYQLKAHQEEGVGQISIWLKQNVKTTQQQVAQKPLRILVAVPDVNFSLDTSDVKPQQGFNGKIETIAIDPGHGGQDFGAIGAGGTREKDVTLQIAKALASLIRDDGRFKVVMTRTDDKTLTLQDRADVANKGKASLFISIHANANPSKKARGWNIFFLAPAKNDSARATEQFENSYFVKELTGSTSDNKSGAGPSDDPVAGILNEMLMTEFQSESHELAMLIDRQFRHELDIPARGVDQAGFFVLNKVFTPSVLVETAFITNKTEAKLLRDSKFQRSVAEGIYAAIRQFADKYNGDN